MRRRREGAWSVPCRTCRVPPAAAQVHAAELLRLANERCDARTCLEADAYASWMGGNVLLEKESDWEGALGRFLRAR